VTFCWPLPRCYGAGKAVDLSDNERDLMDPRGGKRLVQRWAIRTLAALDFGELANDAPIASVQVVGDSLALRLDAKAGFALFASGNPVICDETTVRNHCQPRYAVVIEGVTRREITRSAYLGSLLRNRHRIGRPIVGARPTRSHITTSRRYTLCR
jgi:hypothetical protein